MTPSLQADEKTCPFCAETIKRAAILCRFCHRDLSPEAAEPPVEASPEERAKVLGIEFKDHHWVYRHRYFRELDAALKHAELVKNGGTSDEERAAALGITRSEDRWVYQGSYFKDLDVAIRYAQDRRITAQENVIAPAPKSFKWWLWGPIALVIFIFVMGAINGPKTYADLAVMEAQSCIRSKGNGQWRASLGVTLETFCKTVGNVEARREMCKTHPEAC